jgi:hypothetical protein
VRYNKPRAYLREHFLDLSFKNSLSRGQSIEEIICD